MKKYLVFFLFLAAFGGLILYRRHETLSTMTEVPVTEVIPVRTLSPLPTTFEETVSFAANVEPEETAAVVSKVPGRTVLRVHVNEGDYVKQGQKLAEVDDSLLRQQIAQAEAALGKARTYASTIGADSKRIAALFQENVVSRQQYERMDGEAKVAARQVEEARAGLNQLRIMLGYHTLEAPVSGIVLSRTVDPGDTVSQLPAFIISRQENVTITGGVPERSYPSVRVGQKVFVTLDAFPGERFEGVVLRIAPALDPGTRTGKVEVLLPSGGRIKPGMFARVSLKLGERQGYAVPLEAVGRLSGSGESICFVVSGDAALLRKISTGAEKGGLVEILSGLEPDEKIVASRSEKIRDGVQVKVTDQ
ncbi:MAG: efflux RND transporter periplasmic adaptor subunit [Synergistaceae bacterium]|nr:efflux RND transporter periplasmic adaptor subunit [Synergistaceae bacterium]